MYIFKNLFICMTMSVMIKYSPRYNKPNLDF